MTTFIKKGDLGSVDEVLGWDPRGDEDPYDQEDHERRSAAKLFLFRLATALTNGYRNKDEG